MSPPHVPAPQLASASEAFGAAVFLTATLDAIGFAGATLAAEEGAVEGAAIGAGGGASLVGAATATAAIAGCALAGAAGEVAFDLAEVLASPPQPPAEHDACALPLGSAGLAGATTCTG
ncbi:MAG: hypothetical protein ABSF69_25975 [Polyangiaceae bacterium]